MPQARRQTSERRRTSRRGGSTPSTTSAQRDELRHELRQISDSRGKRRKTASTGIIRTCITIDCSACDERVVLHGLGRASSASAPAASASTCVRCRAASPSGALHQLVQPLGVDTDSRSSPPFGCGLAAGAAG